VKFQNQPLGAITFSAGVAVFPGHGNTSELLLRAADQALYQAKHDGRDRVVYAQEPNSGD
jgi:diguanylate cyclase (GGDEF)-like protein